MKSLRYIVGAFAVGLFLTLVLCVILQRYRQASVLAEDPQTPSADDALRNHQEQLKNDSMYQIGATERD
jgi:hypothetical protein